MKYPGMIGLLFDDGLHKVHRYLTERLTLQGHGYLPWYNLYLCLPRKMHCPPSCHKHSPGLVDFASRPSNKLKTQVTKTNKSWLRAVTSIAMLNYHSVPLVQSYEIKLVKTDVVSCYTEGSKSNIPCCALARPGARNICMMYAGYMTHIVRELYAWYMRQIHAGCARHPTQMLRATRDVTFGPLSQSDMPNARRFLSATSFFPDTDVRRLTEWRKYRGRPRCKSGGICVYCGPKCDTNTVWPVMYTL
jgi:hypothetical protein